MNDAYSKAVMQSHDSKLTSALVKAFETWKEPYDIRPDGVFGSIAIVRTGQVTINSETLDLEFTVPFDDDLEPNEAEIIVYNLSDNTIKQLKKARKSLSKQATKATQGFSSKGTSQK